MFFAVFTQKQPDIPLRVYETFDAASSVLNKLKTAGRNAWVTELDLHLLSHYTSTIDTELREIFDYARFEKFWLKHTPPIELYSWPNWTLVWIALRRFEFSKLGCSSHLVIAHADIVLACLNTNTHYYLN